MSLGLLFAMLIENSGWADYLAKFLAPLTGYAKLSKACATAFGMAFVSSTSANAILSENYEKKIISQKELLIANLLNNSLPVFLNHLPTSIAISFSFAGKAGVYYVMIMFFAAILRLISVILAGHVLFEKKAKKIDSVPVKSSKKLNLWNKIKERFKFRLKNLLLMAIPIYYLVTVASFLGFFNYLQKLLIIYIPNFFLPVEAAALVIFSLAAEFSSGFVAAGALMQSSSINAVEAAAALSLGAVVATPIRVLRLQLPIYLAFYKTFTALLMIITAQLFRVFSILFTLYIFWNCFSS